MESRKGLVKAAEQLDHAAEKAHRVIQKYSNDKKHGSHSKIWSCSNPEKMVEELVEVRNEVVEAWEKVIEIQEEVQCSDMQTHVEKDNTGISASQQDQFQALYVEMMTDTFAEDLEAMREKEAVDVDVLVDCLQSGMEYLGAEERTGSFLTALEVNCVDEKSVSAKLTPHQLRRQKMGYNCSTSS